MTARPTALVAGVGLGAVAGVALAFVQADRMRVGSTALDYGVPLAAGTLLLAQLWLTRALQRRTAAMGVALGWLATSLLMGGADGSGDVVLPANTRAMVYLGLGAMVLTIGILVPVLGRPGTHRLPVGGPQNGTVRDPVRDADG